MAFYLVLLLASLVGLAVTLACVQANRRASRRLLRPIDLAWPLAAPPSLTFLAARAAFECYVDDVARLSRASGSA